jgi:hypothetical protein
MRQVEQYTEAFSPLIASCSAAVTSGPSIYSLGKNDGQEVSLTQT